MYTRPIFFLLLTLIFCTCSTKKGPVIKYKSNIIDLGEIKIKKEFPGKFLIYNTGDEPLLLTEATADCSCTVPDNIKNSAVQPNDSMFVNFKITPAIDGFLQQNIYLDNSSVNESRALFLIRANVKLINE